MIDQMRGQFLKWKLIRWFLLGCSKRGKSVWLCS
jgi:hypothetical protein